MDSEVEEDFDSWLKQLLDSHSVDGEVFGEYISGTLRTIENPSVDEITENLADILSGCVVGFVGSSSAFCMINALSDFNRKMRQHVQL